MPDISEQCCFRNTGVCGVTPRICARLNSSIERAECEDTSDEDGGG